MKIIKLILCILFLTSSAYAGKVEIGLTHDLILNTPQIWNLVKEDIPQPLEVSGTVGRNASHAVWQSVLDNASYVNNAMMFTPVLPWTTVLNSRVPADWPGAWNLDEEGNQVDRKRWWQYTRVFRSADETEAIMQMNGPIVNAMIIDNQFVRGNFHGGCTDDLLKKYIALSGGFLTWKEGLAIINAWGITEE